MFLARLVILLTVNLIAQRCPLSSKGNQPSERLQMVARTGRSRAAEKDMVELAALGLDEDHLARDGGLKRRNVLPIPGAHDVRQRLRHDDSSVRAPCRGNRSSRYRARIGIAAYPDVGAFQAAADRWA